MSDDARSAAATVAGPAGANPILVEVTRGPMVESRHRGSAVVVDTRGKVVAAWGNHDRPVYPRSAVKPLQAIPLVETGAAAAFGLGDSEIALACASHGGEPRHVATVTAWLQNIGRGIGDLECGPQWPSHEDSAHALAAAGEAPTAVHNNCSGKHAGFLATAVHMGEETGGYVRIEHPVQQRILGTLEAMCGLDLSEAPRGIDGCAIPTIAIPLENLAYGMAGFGAPDEFSPGRADACRRIAAAMAAEPFMVAGTDRYCTAVMRVTGHAALVKTGAEGVFCAALPELGLGAALKCDDGTKRAAEVMMSAVLRQLGVLTAEMEAALADWITLPVTNRNGARVGEARATPAFKS
ncbi:MAG: asparaginase [Rhodospirillales bacterium]|nr:MAG: asparaginase [Rhodospirillales bacterium]